MYYLVTINTGAGIERHTVIGNIGAFVSLAYEGGALGVTTIVVQR